ncbi:hypothetical protein HYT26_01480 [Candidatus Pacearchaeota archaeon]|nr:hypothetical protein [Candidatus Pacearchaeota archaeon]
MSIINLIPGVYAAASVLWILSFIVIAVRGISVIISFFINKKPVMNVLLSAYIVHILTLPFAQDVIDETFFNIAAVIVFTITFIGILTTFVFLLKHMLLIKKETGQQDKEDG